jgi:nucleotide-binding universal stress UspA family protein
MNTGTKQVVVGVDGSEASVEALRWAAGYAKSTGASLVAIKAWHYPWAMQTAPAQVDQSVEDQTRTELEQIVEKAGLDVAVECSAREGHAALVLVKASGTADLLVVGGRGHSAFHELMLGSVSLHCVANAESPVVVIRKKR